MSQQSRRKVRWLVIAALVLVPADVALLALLRGMSGSVAANWAAGLSSDERSEAMAVMDRYPMEYRHELLRSASPVERAAVWRQVIDQYLGRHDQLTGGQRDALASARALLTPEAFSGQGRTEAYLARLKSAGNEVIRQLGDADARMLMKELGPSDTSTSELPLLVRTADWLTKRQIASAAACECSSESDWCVWNATCRRSVPNCQPECSWPACGFFLMFCCDGFCFQTS